MEESTVTVSSHSSIVIRLYDSYSLDAENSKTTMSTTMTEFNALFNDTILSNSKTAVYKKFSVNTEVGATPDSNANLIFYLWELSEADNATDKKNVKNIIAQMSSNSHLFVVVLGCDAMKYDDDDLIFKDKKDNQTFKSMTSFMNKEGSDISYTISRLSLRTAKILIKIIEDQSVAGLSAEEIDIVADMYVAKSSKLSPSDKKREVRSFFKKADIARKLGKTGYDDLLGAIGKHFKVTNQKKIVSQNYLAELSQHSIKMGTECIPQLSSILTEIFAISFLGDTDSDKYIKFIEDTDAILKSHVETFCKKNKDHVSIDSNLLTSIDAHKYHAFLSELEELIGSKTGLTESHKVLTTELESVNKIIVNHYNKSVSQMIDLDRISSAFKAFAQKDRKNMLGLFDKIKNNPQIITENLTDMDKWINFIDVCISLDINKNDIISLVEHLIFEKIKKSVDMSRGTAGVDPYPYCLLTFLTKNLSKNFIFEKIFMMLSCNIRYSARNIPEMIAGLTEDRYKSVLKLEIKLVELIE